MGLQKQRRGQQAGRDTIATVVSTLKHGKVFVAKELASVARKKAVEGFFAYEF